MARTKTNSIAEFGDFQTPPALAARVCDLLHALDVPAASIVEPTCGRGAFLLAAAERWPAAHRLVGFDVNSAHLDAARAVIESRGLRQRVSVETSDFFKVHWPSRLADLPEPVLLIGNPPWVTNSHVSAIGGSNLPQKSNFQGHNGFEAITGKANFDISEWMLLQLAEAVKDRRATIAMLVKTAVARKVLQHSWKHSFPISEASLFQIDAMGHFDAAVDAVLMVLRFGTPSGRSHARVYGQLATTIRPIATIGFAGSTLIADLEAHEQTQHLVGASPVKWRSGIKHDCSKVMELQREGNGYRNGLRQFVELEPTYLFPMLKTSEVANGNTRCTRWMVVPQRRIGEDTDEIERLAPNTWRYLQRYADLLAKRGSSIYRGKPQFSIFGVGEYSFAPWKVAISGLYKSLQFTKIGSCEGKPVVLDDATNFLPCSTEEAADFVLELLDSALAKSFFRAHIFWDAKRPVTVDLLSRLNLRALASDLRLKSTFDRLFGEATASRPAARRHPREPVDAPTLW